MSVTLLLCCLRLEGAPSPKNIMGAIDQVEFLESNQVPYLGKPFDLKQLKQSLERLLEPPVEA